METIETLPDGQVLLRLIRGDTWSFPLTFTSDGQPVDITGATVSFTLKKNYNDPDSSALISIDNTSHIDPANGQTIIEVSASSTANLEAPKSYFFDFQIKFADGSVKTIQSGIIEVLPDITRRIV